MIISRATIASFVCFVFIKIKISEYISALNFSIINVLPVVLLFQMWWRLLQITYTKASPPSTSNLRMRDGVARGSDSLTVDSSQLPMLAVFWQLKKQCSRSDMTSGGQYRHAGESAVLIRERRSSVGSKSCNMRQIIDFVSLTMRGSLTRLHTSGQSVVVMASSALQAISCLE